MRPAPVAAALAAAVLAFACAPRPDPPPAAASTDKGRVLAFWEAYRAATDRRIAHDCEGAASRYRDALALDPRHEDSLYYLGQCERERGQAAEARAVFSRLVELNPHSGRGHLALGALLASPEAAEPLDLAGAEAHFRRAHEINGEETGPMVRLAEVMIVDGRAKEARGWLEAAARTNPRSVDAALLSAALAWEAGEREPARRLARAAQASARAEAPVKGVLGEGDRRAGPRAAPSAAPPLENPMGRMLFGQVLAEARARSAARGDVDLPALAGALARARAEQARRIAPTGRRAAY